MGWFGKERCYEAVGTVFYISSAGHGTWNQGPTRMYSYFYAL